MQPYVEITTFGCQMRVKVNCLRWLTAAGNSYTKGLLTVDSALKDHD